MQDLIVSGARVIVSAAEPAVPDGAVLVRDGVVAEVGPSAQVTGRHPGVRVQAHPGATLLPGLVNAHVHLAFTVDRDPVPDLEQGEPATLRTTIEANALDLLDRGVTTARDLGDRDGLVARFRDDVAAGRAAGPRVLTSLAPLTTPKGHCWFLGGEVDGVGEIRAMVARHAEAGADWIKVMAGGGRMTPSAAPVWESQFGRREIDELVAAAADAGLPVAAHAHGTPTMALCAATGGVRTLEHGSWLTGPTAQPRCYDVRDDVAAALAASGTALVSTRGRNWAGWPAEERDVHLERLAWSRGHGIELTPGTDAGVGRGYFDDLVEHLTMYRAAGWSNDEVLTMATTRAAQTLGVGDRTGLLRPGFDADVLVVDGDPLADLEALRDLRCVLARGRPYVPRTAREG